MLNSWAQWLRKLSTLSKLRWQSAGSSIICTWSALGTRTACTQLVPTSSSRSNTFDSCGQGKIISSSPTPQWCNVHCKSTHHLACRTLSNTGILASLPLLLPQLGLGAAYLNSKKLIILEVLGFQQCSDSRHVGHQSERSLAAPSLKADVVCLHL